MHTVDASVKVMEVNKQLSLLSTLSTPTLRSPRYVDRIHQYNHISLEKHMYFIAYRAVICDILHEPY